MKPTHPSIAIEIVRVDHHLRVPHADDDIRTVCASRNGGCESTLHTKAGPLSDAVLKLAVSNLDIEPVVLMIAAAIVCESKAIGREIWA